MSYDDVPGNRPEDENTFDVSGNVPVDKTPDVPGNRPADENIFDVSGNVPVDKTSSVCSTYDIPLWSHDAGSIFNVSSSSHEAGFQIRICRLSSSDTSSSRIVLLEDLLH